MIFLTVGVNYYLISFLAVSFAKPYLQTVCSSLAEALAYATSGVIYQCLGARTSLVLALSLSSLAALAILIQGGAVDEDKQGTAFTILVMLTKFGISGTYNMQLCTLPVAFTPEVIAAGFGIAHFFAVIFNCTTPFVATMQEPYPIVIFAISSAIAATFSWFIKVDESQRRNKAA